MSERIPSGIRVTWSATTCWKKTGTVLAFAPAGVDVLVALGRALAPNERLNRDRVSSYDHYVVAAPRGGKSQIIDLCTPFADTVKREQVDGTQD